MIKVTTDADKAAAKFDRAGNDMMEGIRRGVSKIQNAIMLRATSQYLQGPKPIHLDMLTGRLHKSMQGRLHFEGGTSEGTNYSISSMRVFGNTVVAEYGTKAIDPDSGEDYPAKWEYGGDRRPFLTPAIRDTQGQYRKLMQDSIRFIIRRAGIASNNA